MIFYLCSYSDFFFFFFFFFCRFNRPKRCENNNKDEDNSPKNLNDKNLKTTAKKYFNLSYHFYSSLSLSLSLYIYIYIYTYILTNPYAWAGRNTRSIFKRCLTDKISEFSFSYNSYRAKVEEPSLPYYSLISGWRIIGFILFPRVLMPCEMQIVSSRIWTRVTMNIASNNNHHTMNISTHTHTRIHTHTYTYISIALNKLIPTSFPLVEAWYSG